MRAVGSSARLARMFDRLRHVVSCRISIYSIRYSNRRIRMTLHNDRLRFHNSSRTSLSCRHSCRFCSIHRNLSFFSPFRVFAALPIVFKTIQEAALNIIRRFASADTGKLLEQSHHPIQVCYFLFNLFDLLVASLGQNGPSFSGTKCKVQELLCVFERKPKFLNSLNELNFPHIRFRIFSKSGRSNRLIEKPFPLIESDCLYSNSCRFG